MITVLDIFNRHKSALEKYSILQQFPAGRPLFRIGEPADKAYIIVSGTVVISHLMKNREKELATIEVGDIIGEISLFLGGDRTATARAKIDTSAVIFSREDFAKLKSENCPVACELLEAIIQVIAGRLRTTVKKFEGEYFWLS